MRFTPKTENELAQANLLPAGVYQFEVVEAVDKVSKSGNDMIALLLKVFRDDGDSFVFVNDWIMEKIPYKLAHFCAAAGITEKYESGVLDADDCVGVYGACKVAIEPGGDFPPKNVVKNYVKPRSERREGKSSGGFEPEPIEELLPWEDEIPL